MTKEIRMTKFESRYPRDAARGLGDLCYPRSSILYLLSSIFYLLSSIFYLLSSIFYLLSSIFYLLILVAHEFFKADVPSVFGRGAMRGSSPACRASAEIRLTTF